MAGEEAGIIVANEYGKEADEKGDATSEKENLDEIAEKLYGQTWEDATTIGITDPESRGQRQLQEIYASIGGYTNPSLNTCTEQTDQKLRG